jgi:hypothetical protein
MGSGGLGGRRLPGVTELTLIVAREIAMYAIAGGCMFSRPSWTLPYSSVTPKEAYLNRRRFLAGATALTLGRGLRAGNLNAIKTAYTADGERVAPMRAATSYNNFYEFGTGKDEPAERENCLNLLEHPFRPCFAP